VSAVACDRKKSARSANLLHLDFAGEVKEIDERERSIVHVITDSTIDRMGEIVDPYGADLENFKRNPVVLFGHQHHSVGVIPIIGRSAWQKLVGEQWLSKTIFSDATQFARDAWMLAKEGFLRATSIGFNPLKWETKKLKDVELSPANRSKFDPDMETRIYRKWELWEYSLVPVPANPNALARDALETMRDICRSEYAKSMINDALFEQRVCELERCGANVQMKLQALEELVKKIVEKNQSKPEQEKLETAVKNLTQQELEKLARDWTDRAVRRILGKVS